jgi:hypothetical protein
MSAIVPQPPNAQASQSYEGDCLGPPNSAHLIGLNVRGCLLSGTVNRAIHSNELHPDIGAPEAIRADHVPVASRHGGMVPLAISVRRPDDLTISYRPRAGAETARASTPYTSDTIPVGYRCM